MSIDFTNKLERLVAEVAITAPSTRNKHSIKVAIRWDIIEEIRAELDRRGFEWKAARAYMLRTMATPKGRDE